MRSVPYALRVIFPALTPVGLSMSSRRRWSGIGSFAKVVRFVSMNVLRMP
jgi:hypothetical protein